MSVITLEHEAVKQAHNPLSCIVGVLGGMGPAATADFFAKLVRETPAASDQEHLRTLVWSDASVPDRSDAIMSAGTSPLPRLLEGVRLLQGAGAAIIAMPCSTAHVFLPDLRRASAIPILSMIDASVRWLLKAELSVPRVGLLATTGMLMTGLYQKGLREEGIDTVIPSPLLQQRSVMLAVRLIKAGELAAAKQVLTPAIRSVAEAGAGIIVAACTELPLVLGPRAEGLPVFDPTTALALDVVALAKHLPPHNYTKERP